MSSAVAAEQVKPRRIALPRVALALVAAAQAEVGIWGLIAPRGFFNGFPGLGRHWVVVLGTYNEHLVRDYAATELGFAVLLGGAAILLTRELVLVAGLAFLAATLPHFIYHLTTTDRLSTGDNLGSLGAFVVEMVLVVTAMVVSWRSSERSPDATP
jgi:hypothetical protein